jgi:hypothetical protein
MTIWDRLDAHQLWPTERDRASFVEHEESEFGEKLQPGKALDDDFVARRTIDSSEDQ